MQNTSKNKNISYKGREARHKTAARAAFRARLTAVLAVLAAFAACLMLVFSHSVIAFADSEREDDNTFVAGIFNFEGYHMKDEDGNLSGYGIEFLNLVSEYSRINFKYTGYDKDWDDMIPMLENREIDVVTSASRTPDREQKFAFSLPIGRKKTVLSIRVDDTERHRGDYQTYNGMTVGVLTENSQNDILVEFAEKNDFDYTTVDYANSKELAAALQNHDVDAILSSDLRKAENEKTLDIIEEDDFYAIVRKENADLINEINYAIEQMDINEGDWQNELFYKYYGPVYSSSLSFNERETEYIGQVVSGQKTIAATAFCDRAPYSYTENSELKGIMPDYFAEVMKLAGLPYRLVAPKDNDDYNNIVAANTVNVVLDSVGADGTLENTDRRGFNTDSYMTASMAMVTRHDLKNNVEVVAVSDSQGKDLIDPEFLEDYTVRSYDSGDAAMRAVLNKEADAAYVYAYSAQLFINRDSSNSLYYSIMNGMSTSFSMHVSENTDHELITILNKCIKQMSDDTLNQLASKYTSHPADSMSFMEYMRAHPEIPIAVSLVLAVIVFVIVALILRGRWNKKLLLTTEQSNKKMSEQLAIVEALSRDYTNVFAVGEDRDAARVIKMDDRVAKGLNGDPQDGHNYADILDEYIKTRVHPDDRQELSQALSLENVREKLKTDSEYTGSYRVVDGDDVHYFQYTFLKIADVDHSRGDFILVGFRNIDEMIRKEQEQKQVLSEALARAQYANKAKTTFLNSMSHDIRTPMNAIIGFTSLAASHLDDKKQTRDYLGKIMTSGNHLLNLINDVLDMSRIESGKVKIEEKEASLPEIMHDLITIVQADVKAKDLEFDVEAVDVTNETVICDKIRLSQVLLNLLSNAIKYTMSGGKVGVRVVQKPTAAEGRATYEFGVKDTGIGMSSEFLQHVFEPFEREQTSTVSGIQGTGLGLAITKNIVDMMGGTITVQSEEGKGSEFTVTFDFRIQGSPAVPPLPKQFKNRRALVMDDDQSTCDNIGKMLSAIGMRPASAAQADEAVDRVKCALENNEPYGAFIIDRIMPDKKGLQLVRRIRTMTDSSTPIIILTAYDWSGIEKKATEAGVTAFCSKPIFLSELRGVLAAPYTKKEHKDEAVDSAPHLEGKKILLVEDNELNQEIAQSILEAAGLTVDTANDGSVAVERMKSMPQGTYDLILMDVQMPIMNGYQATRAIRALDDPVKAAIPIVAMTANAFDEDKKEAMDSGMNGYAAKPIDIDSLLKTLDELIN